VNVQGSIATYAVPVDVSTPSEPGVAGVPGSVMSASSVIPESPPPESTAPLLLPLPLLEPLLPPLLPPDDEDESKPTIPLSKFVAPPPGGPLLCEQAANHADATRTAAHPLLFVIPPG